MINKTTQNEQKIGYSACKECTSGIHLHEAGFDVETHRCAKCKCWVADTDEFFKMLDDVEIYQKERDKIGATFC